MGFHKLWHKIDPYKAPAYEPPRYTIVHFIHVAALLIMLGLGLAYIIIESIRYAEQDPVTATNVHLSYPPSKNSVFAVRMVAYIFQDPIYVNISWDYSGTDCANVIEEELDLSPVGSLLVDGCRQDDPALINAQPVVFPVCATTFSSFLSYPITIYASTSDQYSFLGFSAAKNTKTVKNPNTVNPLSPFYGCPFYSSFLQYNLATASTRIVSLTATQITDENGDEDTIVYMAAQDDLGTFDPGLGNLVLVQSNTYITTEKSYAISALQLLGNIGGALSLLYSVTSLGAKALAIVLPPLLLKCGVIKPESQ